MFNIYTIRDQKAKCYNRPFFLKEDGEAEREFDRLVNDKSSFINQYPDDYDLYKVGTWNDHDGVIVPLDTPQHMRKAVQHIKA